MRIFLKILLFPVVLVLTVLVAFCRFICLFSGMTRYPGGAAVPDRVAGAVRRSGGWLYRVYDTGMAGQSLRLADGSFLADGSGGRLQPDVKIHLIYDLRARLFL